MGVRSEQDGFVRIVVIDRPDRANAIDLDMALELSEVFDSLEHDDRTRAIVLTGAGDRVFSAGMDLEAVDAGQAAAINGVSGGFGGIVKRTLPQPVLAAVNGAAIGGGFEIVLACDLVLAAAHARFGLPEVTKGLFPASGGALRLPARMPPVLAMECMLLGEPIGAERARELGLVNRVVPATELLERSVDLAARVAACDPGPVQAVTQLVRMALSTGISELWSLNDDLAAQVTGHAREPASTESRSFVHPER